MVLATERNWGVARLREFDIGFEFCVFELVRMERGEKRREKKEGGEIGGG